MKTTANQLLNKAAAHMEQRAATYDKPAGERSMAATVVAFNAITGQSITESEGWLLMQILKDVRDRQRSAPHQDSLEDGIAYAALKAEARLQEADDEDMEKAYYAGFAATSERSALGQHLHDAIYPEFDPKVKRA